MQSVSAYQRVEKIIDQIKTSDEAGIIILPEKFEKARLLVLQLDYIRLQDVVDLTANE